MLKKYALVYLMAGQMLENANGGLFVGELFDPETKVVGSDKEQHRNAIAALKFAAEACRQFPLGNLGKEIDRALEEYKDAALSDRLKMELKRIGERFRDELESRRFLYVTTELAKFYEQNHLFGPWVSEKFPNAQDDIRNAGNCYALGESTACVFHLMRAMEVVVQKLARRLSITVTPRTTWRVLTGAMDGKIKNLPETTVRQKRKKEAWEASRANLHHVGSVWRNGTMHPAKTYTQSQARDVLDATRVFMTALCDL
jgi:hypothetical protein